MNVLYHSAPTKVRYNYQMIFLLPILSAALLIAAFPPLEWSWCVYFALIPLLFFIDRARSTKELCLGASIVAILYGAFSLFPLASTNAWWWLAQGSLLFQNKELVLYSFLALLILIGDVPFFVLFALSYRKVFAKDSPFRHWLVQILAVAVCWSVLEYVRSFVPGGIAWQELAVSVAPQEYVRQSVQAVGLYGLGFFVAIVNVCLYQWGLQWRQYRYPVAIFLAFLTIFSYGTYRIGHAETGPTIRVAAIHSSLTTQEESVGLNGFRYYEKAVGTALSSNPDLVVLPENAISFLVIDEATMLPIGYALPGSTFKVAYDTILAWSQLHPKTVFLIGLHSKRGDASFNSVAYIEDGYFHQLYHKRHLLPLSEGDFRSGAAIDDDTNDSFAFQTSIGRISPFICSEILYSDIAARAGEADLLTVSGNDAIFGSSIVARRGREVAMLRAVQAGKHIVISTKGLESVVISPFGEILHAFGSSTISIVDVRI